ncbi:F-box/RNI-like/FBD-like domains-containing protein [Euphorbia peplus]|nr:F-box/RNI-like/FBD-like domains-containing protein [Euphorbia peplus]
MVLIRHSHPCLRRFRLHPSNSYPTSVVISWISYAITHNVKKLDLCMPGNVKLPPTLFNCTTIRVLKLTDGIDLDVPESVSLPNLKVVHFQSLPSLCDDSISRILSGSPILKKLVIYRSGTDGVNILSIVSSTLKTLIITSHNGNPYEVVIDAPKLEYLSLMIQEVSSCYTAVLKLRMHPH